MIRDLIETYVHTGKFSVQEFIIAPENVSEWVKIRGNPDRFLPKLFDGDWADLNQSPKPGPIKLIRIIPGNDGVHRLIGRQGKNLYAAPWLE